MIIFALVYYKRFKNIEEEIIAEYNESNSLEKTFEVSISHAIITNSEVMREGSKLQFSKKILIIIKNYIKTYNGLQRN